MQFRLELEALMPLVVKIEVFAQMPANRCGKTLKRDFYSGLGVFFEMETAFSRTRAAFEGTISTVTRSPDILRCEN